MQTGIILFIKFIMQSYSLTLTFSQPDAIRSTQFDKRTVSPIYFCEIFSFVNPRPDFSEDAKAWFQGDAKMFSQIIIYKQGELIVIQSKIFSCSQSITADRGSKGGTTIKMVIDFMFIGQPPGQNPEEIIT